MPTEKTHLKSDIHDYAPKSLLPHSTPFRTSKDSQQSSGLPLSKEHGDHPAAMDNLETKRKGGKNVECSSGQETKDKTRVKKLSPTTTTQPVSLHSHKHDNIRFQVAKRTGKSNQGISREGTTAWHTSTKRKRNHELDTLDRPAKATRKDDDGERRRMGHAPEAPNTSSLVSDAYTSTNAGHHDQHESMFPLPPLSKFGIIQWANQLGSSAYLRDMGKADRKVYNSLIETLSRIKLYKDHRTLTPKMLKETKLAVEVHKFVDQSSDSPESTLANEIYAHWQSTFRF